MKAPLFQATARVVLLAAAGLTFASLGFGQFVQPLGSQWNLDGNERGDHIQVALYSGTQQPAYGARLITTGAYQLDVTGHPIPPGTPSFQDMLLFCVEMAAAVPESPPANFYTLKDLQFAAANNSQPGLQKDIPATGIGLVRADRLEVLYGTVFGTEANAFEVTGVLNTAKKRTAFQLAVWELSHDTNFNLELASGTGFRLASADAEIITLAQGYVTGTQTALDLYGSNAARIELAVFSHPTLQDYIVVIPEPGTYAVLLSGITLLAVVLIRRRRSVALN